MRGLWRFAIFILASVVTASSTLDGISGLVTVIKKRQELAERVKNVERGKVLLIAFTGNPDFLNKADLAHFTAIHEALYDKSLEADFIIYAGPISDAMANQYALHSFALPKVVACRGSEQVHVYDGGRQAVHVQRWLHRLKRVETDL